jgi:DNA-binding transcriptional LysR family regulator
VRAGRGLVPTPRALELRERVETGVVPTSTPPEVHAQALFRDRLVGVVRLGHALCGMKITLSRYANGRHILVSRRDLETGPIDDAFSRGQPTSSPASPRGTREISARTCTVSPFR